MVDGFSVLLSSLKHPSKEEAIEAVQVLLTYIGEDPSRPGLRDTPARVLKAWENEWGAGYKLPDFNLTAFDTADADYGDQMLLQRDIVFFSHCEHHMTPFYGTAQVAYIPKDKIIGLSKLARIVQHFASRLQVQERLTGQVASYIEEHVSPDCAVSMEAVHMCMLSRGCRQPRSSTVTTALRGLFKHDAATQSEFVSRVRTRD